MGGILSSITESFAFQPPSMLYDPKDYETIYTDKKEAVHYYYFQNPNPRSKYTILFSHGNACNIIQIWPVLKELATVWNVSLLAYEYPGYITVDFANPSEVGTYRAIATVWEHLTQVRQIPAGRIILMGQSLGSGPTTDLAMDQPFAAATILISPFRSCTSLVSESTCMDLTANIFRNESKAEYIRTPVLIVHGGADDTVPITHGKRICDLCPRSQGLWLRGTGHNDIMQNMECIEGISQFIQLLNSPGSPMMRSQ